jgi:predicted O-linked N-acetylglucosamine transferase (SPINDLY family)
MAESLTPDQAYERAIALHMGGSLDQAEEIYRLILQAVPSHGPSLQAMGVLLGQKGRYLASEPVLRQAAQAMPENADAWSNLGNVLRILERFEESVEACRRAVALNPRHSFARGNLSGSLRLLGRSLEALAEAEEAVALDPGNLEARVNQGCSLQNLGRLKEAIEVFRQASQRHPESLYAWSCLLMALQYSDLHRSDDLWAEVQRFRKTQPPPPSLPKPSSIRRVGFLSGDFCRHPVGLFILPLLQGWNRSRHELHLFSCLPGRDEVTESLASCSDGFHEIAGLPDPEAHRLIRMTGIDLLIDLAGHTAKNRIPLLMSRPAPLQASYLGYSATTGLKAMDFLIGDSWCTPPEHDRWFTERVVRLKGSLFGVVTPGPVRCSSGPPRLGCFNNPAKISDSALRLWRQLMESIPEAVMVLKYRGLEDLSVQDAFLRRLDLPRERVEFHGWTSQDEHQVLIEGLTMGLDPFPYSGATTTRDLVSRGIPIPSLVGDRYVSRMSASVLQAGGWGSLICRSHQEWLDQAESICRREPFPIQAPLEVDFSCDFQDAIDGLA